MSALSPITLCLIPSRQGLIEPESQLTLARLASQQALSILLCPPGLEEQACVHLLPFSWLLVIQTRVPMLSQEMLMHRVTPRPVCWFLTCLLLAVMVHFGC